MNNYEDRSEMWGIHIERHAQGGQLSLGRTSEPIVVSRSAQQRFSRLRRPALMYNLTPRTPFPNPFVYPGFVQLVYISISICYTVSKCHWALKRVFAAVSNDDPIFFDTGLE